MKLKILPFDLTVCKLSAIDEINIKSDFFFIGKTENELSLVCKKEETPLQTTEREDGWRGFFVDGKLDFSLIGILSDISSILAKEKISIFALSTYNTDYILVKKEQFDSAVCALEKNGYETDY